MGRILKFEPRKENRVPSGESEIGERKQKGRLMRLSSISAVSLLCGLIFPNVVPEKYLALHKMLNELTGARANNATVALHMAEAKKFTDGHLASLVNNFMPGFVKVRPMFYLAVMNEMHTRVEIGRLWPRSIHHDILIFNVKKPRMILGITRGHLL